jgi:DNA polymerase III subunit chi
MTEIAFHFNVQDQVEYTCRLVRKAHMRGALIALLADPDTLERLDTHLWSFAATEFLPHCRQGAGEAAMAETPILLLESPQACPHQDLLINLAGNVPSGFERFGRFIEIVTGEPADRQAARTRWKYYQERGYALKQHDLAAAGAPA